VLGRDAGEVLVVT